MLFHYSIYHYQIHVYDYILLIMIFLFYYLIYEMLLFIIILLLFQNKTIMYIHLYLYHHLIKCLIHYLLIKLPLYLNSQMNHIQLKIKIQKIVMVHVWNSVVYIIQLILFFPIHLLLVTLISFQIIMGNLNIDFPCLYLYEVIFSFKHSSIYY